MRKSSLVKLRSYLGKKTMHTRIIQIELLLLMILKLLGWIWAILSVIWLGWTLMRNLGSGGVLPDFRIYYRAAEAVSKGKDPYRITHGEFWYPGLAVGWFTPFLAFDVPTAEMIWTILSTIVLFGSTILWARLVGEKWVNMGWVIGAVATMFPAKFTLGMGQINHLVLFLLVITMWCLKKDKQKWCGILLGTVFLTKFLPGLWMIYLWFRGKKIVAIWTAGVILVGSLLWSGWWNSYINVVLPRINGVWESGEYYNQGLSGTLSRLGVEKRVNLVLGVVVVMGCFLWVLIRPGDMLGDLSFLLAVEVVGRGIVWQHHLVWLMVPLIWLWGRSTGGSKIGVIVSYLLVAANIKNPQMLHGTIWLSHGFLGVMILAIMVGKKRLVT